VGARCESNLQQSRVAAFSLALELSSRDRFAGHRHRVGEPTVRASTDEHDTSSDGHEFLYDVLYGMPDAQHPIPEPSLLATDPGAEKQAPGPVRAGAAQPPSAHASGPLRRS
jgi:hypothetical protein